MRISSVVLVIGVILVFSGLAVASGAVTLEIAQPNNGKPYIVAEFPSGSPTDMTPITSLTIDAWFEMFLPYSPYGTATVASYTINNAPASAYEVGSNATGELWNYSATITLSGSSGSVTFSWGAAWWDSSGNFHSGGYSYITYWELQTSPGAQSSLPPSYQSSSPSGSSSSPTVYTSTDFVAWIHMFIPSLSTITSMSINGMTVEPTQYATSSSGVYENYSQQLAVQDSPGSVLFTWTYTYLNNNVRETSTSSVQYYYTIELPSNTTTQSTSPIPVGEMIINGVTIVNSAGHQLLNSTEFSGTLNMYFIPTQNASAIQNVVVNIYTASGSSLSSITFNKLSNGTYYASYTISPSGEYTINGKVTTSTSSIQFMSLAVHILPSSYISNSLLGILLIVSGAVLLVVFFVTRHLGL
ncbi:MAG: hypothetical protein QXV17_14650 [Candidatus Micrarchaeaceae archaeon]